MAATTGFSTEIASKVSAARIICGAQEAHNHAPQSMPHLTTEFVNHKGDGGAGTVRFIRLCKDLPFSHLKVHLDVVDKENYEFKFTLLEGVNLGKKLASAVYCYKMTPTDDGACVCKITGDFTILPGAKFTEKDIEEEKEFFVSFFKAMEKYLLENPEACT